MIETTTSVLAILTLFMIAMCCLFNLIDKVDLFIEKHGKDKSRD